MGLFNLFRNKEKVFQENTVKYHAKNLSIYKHCPMKLAHTSDEATQKVLSLMETGDVLLFSQCQNRSLQYLAFYNLYGHNCGQLTQNDSSSILEKHPNWSLPSPMMAS